MLAGTVTIASRQSMCLSAMRMPARITNIATAAMQPVQYRTCPNRDAIEAPLSKTLYKLLPKRNRPRSCKLPPMRQLHAMRHAGVVHIPTALAFGNLLPQIRQPNIGTIAFNQSLLSESAFDIGPSVRIWRTTGAPCRRDNRGVLTSRCPCLPPRPDHISN
jgi:hypothetical protein